MPKSSAALDTVLITEAESLGIELNPEAFKSLDSKTKTSEALSALSVSKLTTPEYLEKMEELTKSTSKALAEIAKSSGSPEAAELLEKFDSKIKDSVSNLTETVMEKLSKGEKFGPEFERMCSTTNQVLEDGLKLIGSTGQSDKDKDVEKDKDKEEMRKLMMMLAVIIGCLFLSHFGVSAQTISMAGMAFKYLSENKDKSAVDMAKDIATRVATDKEFRHTIGDKAIGIAEIVSPGLKSLGLREKAMELEGKIENSGAVELFDKAKAMVAAIPPASKAKEAVAQEIFGALDTVLDRSLAESPELCTKFKKLLSDVKERNNGEILGSLGSLVAEGVEKRGIVDKAKDMISSVSSVGDAIDKFKVLASAELAPTSAEKILLERVSQDMKSYMYDRYAKPVKDFCEAAQKSGAGELAQHLGISKDITKVISGAITKLEPSGHFISR